MKNSHNNKNGMISNILIGILIFVTIAIITGGTIYDNNRDTKVAKIAEIQNKKEFSLEQKQEKAKEVLTQKMKTIGKGKVLKYCPMGDSLTAGFYATTEDKAFVSVLSNLLYKNMGFKVQKTVTAKYGGLLSGALQHVDEVNAQNPDLVSIEFGTNDSNPENHVSPDMFKMKLNTLIDDITIKVDHHPLIVLVTTWNKGDGYKYDEVIREVGQKRNIPVADITSIWNDASNIGPEGTKVYDGTRDNFHPNDAGMENIANAIFNEIQLPIFNRYNKQ